MESLNKFKNNKVSITTQIFNKIKDLEKEGKEIISFTAGDPYGNISDKMKTAVINALDKETNHYTSTLGTVKLRTIIAETISKTDNTNISFENIVVTNGAKQAIYSVLNAILNIDDEVIIFNPTWRAYSEITTLVGGIPRFINLKPENNYNIDFNELKNNITNKTKAIIINNPNNPTGKIIDKESLKKLLEIAVENNLYLISDEVYREIIFIDNKFVSLNSFLNETNKDNIIVINSLSKSNAMAGWRIGYMNIPLKLIKPITILQAYTTTNVNTLAQEIAIEALLNDNEFIQKQRNDYKEKSQIILNYLKDIKGLKVDIIPEGAYYIWVNIKEITNDSIKFCEEILEKIYISLVPGVDYGVNGYIRISCSNSIENIHIGMQRLKDYLNNK